MIINIFKNKDYKKINQLALPLILNNILSLIIELCDQGIMGRVSITSFAAVGLIETSINSITGVLGSISVAFNILGSRYKGKNDFQELNNNLILNLILSFCIGLIFFIMVLLCGRSILKVSYGFTGSNLKESSNYLYIFSISLGLNMILFTFSSYLKIIHKTKYIFYGNMVAALSNLVFDYVLVFGHAGFPRMGMIGNAIGSILALVLNVIVYVVVIMKVKIGALRKANIFANLKDAIKISIPLMGQEFLESTLIVCVVNSILSYIGTLEVAVYNLLFIIINIALMPMYGYAQASLTIISESINNKRKEKLKISTKCIILAEIFYILIAMVMIIFRYKIPCIITNNKELITTSIKYILLVIISNLLYIPGTVFKYSLQAIGKEKWVFSISIIINFIEVGIILLFVWFFKWGLYGVYVGIMLGYMTLTVILFLKMKY